ncbi:hypothetical protein M3212_12790 [Alkalihalobacillus oceani]|uniref:hypothetical protein n=1 Tax=Halalkalibacter oceani TaxID=1653776 RepID=UPI002041DA3B|nr:hypothetical protein [Halalkalibacter oceani]MCM3761665.1 hypothetical protein [Halalkalibacter oceani]
MSHKGLQSFAGGLFLATAILGGTYYYTHSMNEEAEPERIELSAEDMMSRLTAAGYTVLTEAELEAVRDEASSGQQEGEQEKQQIIYQMVLTISSGMTSYQVADQLVTGQIIDEVEPFLDYLRANGLTQSIRTGQFLITSEMTVEEIIAVIT